MPEEVQCHRCGGRGYVYVPNPPGRKTAIPRKQPCHMCDGKGTQAPLGWLEAVVQDTPQETDEHSLDITIQSAADNQLYVFSYSLGDIRAELKRRQNDGQKEESPPDPA